MSATAPTIIYVTYQGSATTRFDRGYYVGTHLPLVMKAWEGHGLESAAAFFPAAAQDGTIAICELRFRDDAALAASLASADTSEVMADVARFTDVKPVLARAVSV
ncbi:EthD family reductase [Pseudoroseomonas ludipueritiae]|uniref:EthD family reductase n=1 Tax=Pseudoroseomonas ludipueritiae TaxID=198093 RepID=A0ABR7R1W7_9PROT|nr:EthD family reductase [Pseudoroseomonas ludipueritiae]MBC9175697.1 EthD family reductase [Pseudoroseomonas ludipueritiae]MCG7360406.1 EthD family reductase [Roseomonas sp. ACRSG]